MKAKQKKKAVLITGATRRLGLAFAKQSLLLGFSIVAHYRTTASPLKQWLQKHARYKKNVYFIQADLTDDPSSLIDQCVDFPVALTGLVNNVSLFTEGDFNDVDHLKRTLFLNTAVPFLLSRRFSQKVRTGWIVHITDANTSWNKRFQNYRFSKIVLGELTRQQASLFAPLIRVNAIAPGAILPPAHKERTYFDRMKNTVPLKKGGNIQSVMKAYTFLVENTCVTGHILYVDNGLHLLNPDYS